MEKIRVAIVGATGGRAQGQLAFLAADERVQITTLVSRRTDDETLRNNAARVGAEIVREWQKAVSSDRVDAVLVCVPNVLHFEVARAALKAGKHVYVEYPIVQTPRELDELESLAKSRRLVLCGGLNVLAEPDYLAVKAAMAKIGSPVTAHRRYFGDPKRTTWYVDPALCGEMYLALHIHFIWQFRGLLGKVRWVNAETYDRKGERYCYGSIHMGHESGATSLIEFGMGLPRPPAPLQGFFVQGTDGCISIDGKAARITKRIDAEPETIPFGPNESTARDTGGFINRILGTGELLSSLDDNREAMELCRACVRSDAEGGRVALEDREPGPASS